MRTKDTALSENGSGAAWHVWINAAGERHGMCELILTHSIVRSFYSLWLPMYELLHLLMYLKWLTAAHSLNNLWGPHTYPWIM
jgi:hypothetical protein